MAFWALLGLSWLLVEAADPPWRQVGFHTALCGNVGAFVALFCGLNPTPETRSDFLGAGVGGGYVFERSSRDEHSHLTTNKE